MGSTSGSSSDKKGMVAGRSFTRALGLPHAAVGGQAGTADAPDSWVVASPMRDRCCGTDSSGAGTLPLTVQPLRYKTTIYHMLN